MSKIHCVPCLPGVCGTVREVGGGQETVNVSVCRVSGRRSEILASDASDLASQMVAGIRLTAIEPETVTLIGESFEISENANLFVIRHEKSTVGMPHLTGSLLDLLSPSTHATTFAVPSEVTLNSFSPLLAQYPLYQLDPTHSNSLRITSKRHKQLATLNPATCPLYPSIAPSSRELSTNKHPASSHSSSSNQPHPTPTLASQPLKISFFPSASHSKVTRFVLPATFASLVLDMRE